MTEAFLCLRNFYAGCIWNRVIQGWFGWEYYSLGKRYFFLADFWFLISMFFASILFFLIADRALRSKVKSIAATVILFAVTGLCQQFGVVLPYNLQLVPYWTAFMLLGALAGQIQAFDHPALSNGMKWGLGIAALAVGFGIALVKAPALNLFRGSFGSPELRSMLLCIAAGIPALWGMGQICALAEAGGLRIRELAWVGSHSLIIYLFHMFFAWVIGLITGFSVMYPETVSADTVWKSVLLTLACLALGVAANVVQDRWKARKQG